MQGSLSAALGQATIVTAGSRQARRIRQQWSLHKQNTGFVAWAAPDVLPWTAWIRREWRDLLYSGADVPPLLSTLQEKLLWERIIEDSPEGRELLRVDAAAGVAAEAWALAHSWRLPLDSAQFDISDDASAFRRWAREFDALCQQQGVLDTARLPDLLMRTPRESEKRVVLYGFDELDPRQKAFADVYRMTLLPIEERHPGSPALAVLPDADSEIERAAAWARSVLESQPDARIGIAVPRLESLRPSIERVLHATLHPAGSAIPAFHVSLGPPLSERPAVHAALSLLGTVAPLVTLATIGRILLSPWIGCAAAEQSARSRFDAWLRRDGIEYTLVALAANTKCPPAFADLLRAVEQVRAVFRATQAPSAWSRAFSSLLRAYGWPGDRVLTSTEFQTVEAFREALSELATLDSVLPAVTAQAALALVRRIVEETTFQPEDLGQPVQVVGLIEASQESFDHLWVLGLDDESWPRAVSPNPFLPLSLQREYGLPHATAQWELEWSRRVTKRLLAAAPNVTVSYARLAGEREMAPSPLVSHLPPDAGTASAGLPLPNGRGSVSAGPLTEPRPSGSGWPAPSPWMETLVDKQAPPLPETIRHSGGTRALQIQAACPFRAFAEIRLGARPLETPPLGFDARTRGMLLHSALQLCWTALRSQAELQRTPPEDLAQLIESSVARAILDGQGRPRSPFDERLQAVEHRRLTALLTRWLDIDRARIAPFVVLPPEQPRELHVGGLTLSARIDRIDQLTDGRLVIIDYKSSAPSVAAWEGDRPDQPQVPLYAISTETPLAAVAFAQVQTGDTFFRGLGTEPFVLPGLKPAQLDELVERWRTVLTQLAEEFRAGHAAVDPKERDTCKFCSQHALCRIDESR